MKKFLSKMGAALVMLLLLALDGRAQVAEPKGELQIYGMETQIGTVACRVHRDIKRRVVKAIYYSSSEHSAFGPFREDSLHEQSIHTYAYDEHDCPVRSESFEPGMKLIRISDKRCFDGTSTPRLTVVRNARGVKLVETRHKANGGTQTDLYFDNDGDKVIGINGETPNDVDLARGWGKEFGGFACGIAANRDKGRQEELHVTVTIKNLSPDADELLMATPVIVELKDSTGRVVEPKAEYRIVENESQSEGCPNNYGQGVPSVGRSQLQTGYALGEQYDRLAPGSYSFTVSYCVSKIRGSLVSNTIPLEIAGHDKH